MDSSSVQGRMSVLARTGLVVAALVLGMGCNAHAQAGKDGDPPPRPLTVKSLCVPETLTKCRIRTFTETGQPKGEQEVSNAGLNGLPAVDAGKGMLRVSTGTEELLVRRIDVVLVRHPKPVNRTTDCQQIAGVRASGC